MVTAMAWKIDHRIENDRTIITPRGTISIENLAILFERLRDIHRKYRAPQVVIECQAITGLLKTKELYTAVLQYLVIVGDRLTIACINLPEFWRMSDLHFIESAISNRGGALRFFAMNETARLWLSKA